MLPLISPQSRMYLANLSPVINVDGSRRNLYFRSISPCGRCGQRMNGRGVGRTQSNRRALPATVQQASYIHLDPSSCRPSLNYPKFGAKPCATPARSPSPLTRRYIFSPLHSFSTPSRRSTASPLDVTIRIELVPTPKSTDIYTTLSASAISVVHACSTSHSRTGL